MKKYYSANTFEKIYISIIEDIITAAEFRVQGRDGRWFRETSNLLFELSDPRARMVFNAKRNTNYEFAMKMFIWVITGSDDYEYLGSSNKNAIKFIDASTDEEARSATFNTAYGPRIARQIGPVLEELERNPGTRRAVINILSEEDKLILSADTKTEFPCAESITFSIRDNLLNCHVNMRSNNMVTTVVYDVFVFTMLQEYILASLNTRMEAIGHRPSIGLGTYSQHCTSAHVFEDEMGLGLLIIESKDVSVNRHDRKEVNDGK